MTEEHRTYLFGLLEKQFGKMSTRERLIAGSIIDEAVNLATNELQEKLNNQAISIGSYQEDLKKAGELLRKFLSLKNTVDNSWEAREIMDVRQKAKEFIIKIQELGCIF